MPLDVKKIRALKGNTLTPTTLRAEGVAFVVIQPNGQIAEELFTRYLSAGEPDGSYFERHLVVSIDVWERTWMRRPPAQTFDPVSGEPETPESAAGWARCAPLRVLADGGKSTTVSAADLCAYAAATGRLAAGFNSMMARMALPKGLEPVDGVEVEILTEAALAWPYDRDAATIATDRRRGAGQRKGPPPLSTRSDISTPTQTVVNLGSVINQSVVHGGIGVQINGSGGYTAPPRTLSGPQHRQLVDLLRTLFTLDELRRFLRYLPAAGGLVEDLPEGNANLPTVADAAVTLLQSRGLVDRALFSTLLNERPARGRDIQIVREQLGC